MQVYTNSNRQRVKTIFAFLLVLFVAYLPVSTFLFFIKNDAFNGYFPPKFFMSESIHAGHLPLWNPYINFGIPQYGDMSSGFWSPVTWLIASTVGYNAYTFTLEVLAYIFIGGIGMYKLMSCWNIQNRVRFIAAISFMCCGYNIGHLQHFNWLSGTAFLPWCVWGYLRLQQNLTLQNILQGVLLFYLFMSSAHPGLIIGAFYFFVALAIFLFFKNEAQQDLPHKIKRFVTTHFFLLPALILLGAGMVIGYLDILPNFSRGSKVPLEAALKAPVTFQSWLSFLFPFGITKNDSLFSTDISMRNVYIGITLLLFLLLNFFRQKSSWQKFFLFSGLAFLLLSAGGIFETFAYKFIPLIGYVRLGGEFVIFSILCFIIVAAMELDRFFREKRNFSAAIRYIYYTVEIILFLSILFGLYEAIHTKDSFLFSIKNTISQGGFSDKLKALIDAVSFYDAFWLQGIIQLLLLWGIKFALREKRSGLLTRIVIADMIIATLLNLPFTGVGKASVAEVQSVLNRSPKGIPIPALQPIINNDTVSIKDKGLVGDWSFYNKQIGVANEASYPIRLNNMRKYFDADPALKRKDKGFLFTESTNAKPVITFFSGNKIRFNLDASDTEKIIYQQAYYPHWFYSNGQDKKEVQQYSIAFMSVPLTKGKNEIEIFFDPKKVKAAMVISLVSFCCIVILLLLNPRFIRRSLFPS